MIRPLGVERGMVMIDTTLLYKGVITQKSSDNLLSWTTLLASRLSRFSAVTCFSKRSMYGFKLVLS
jgi:hypothetical protein